MHRLILILLLVCLPLHSFAAQIAAVQPLASAGMPHELEHAQDLHHHHDTDGSVHYDDSDESREHTDKCSYAQQQLVATAVNLFSPMMVARVNGAGRAAAMPLPYLEEPQRPPSFAPGLAAGG